MLLAEDYKKIEKYFRDKGVRDTQFPYSKLPLSGKETVSIVQDNKNTKISVKELIKDLSEFIELEGSTFMGFATPDKIPVINTDNGIFYIAFIEGTYKYFSDIYITGEYLVILNLPKKTNNTDRRWEVISTGVRMDTFDTIIEIKEKVDRLDNIIKQIIRNHQTDYVLINDKINSINSDLSIVHDKLEETYILAENAVSKDKLGVPNGVATLNSDGKIEESQMPFSKIDLIDNYINERRDAAATANALHQLYLYHRRDQEIIKSKIDAVLDLVAGTTELGVSPQQIEVRYESTSLQIQIICNGEWHIGGEIPARWEVDKTSGVGSSTINIILPSNNTEDDITESIRIVNNFGKEKTVTILQKAIDERYEYSLEITPSVLNSIAIYNETPITIKSVRRLYRGKVAYGEEEIVPVTIQIPRNWVLIEPIENNISYTHKVITTENVVDEVREMEILIEQEENTSGIIGTPLSTSFEVKQKAANVLIDYLFNITPSEISSPAIGKKELVELISKKVININGTINEVEAPFTYTSNSDQVYFDNTDSTVNVLENVEETSRNYKLTFLQKESKREVILNVNQEAAIITTSYTFTIDPEVISFRGRGETKSLNIIDNKTIVINNTTTFDGSIGFTTTETGDWFSLDDSKTTIDATPNSDTTSRTGKVMYMQNESNNVVNVDLYQDEVEEEIEYEFTVSPKDITLDAWGNSQSVNIVSRKRRLLNGIPEDWENVPYTTQTGGTSGATITVNEDLISASLNDGNIERNSTVTFTQEESNKQEVINVTQLVGEVTWEYEFSIDPTSMNFIALGETKQYILSTYKKKYIDGVYTDVQERVGIQTSSSDTAFSVTYNNAGSGDIIASENTSTSSRTSNIVFTQDESNKTVTLVATQAAGVVTYQYFLDPGDTSWKGVSPYGASKQFYVYSKKSKFINGKQVSSEDIGYTATASGTGLSCSKSGPNLNVTWAENATSSNFSRTGTITISQTEGNKSVVIQCEQEASIKTTEYELRYDKNISCSERNILITSQKISKINGKETGRKNVLPSIYVNGSWTPTLGGTGLIYYRDINIRSDNVENATIDISLNPVPTSSKYEIVVLNISTPSPTTGILSIKNNDITKVIPINASMSC